MTIIEGAENIERFQLIRMRKALELEIATGMKLSRGSVLAAAQRQFGSSPARRPGPSLNLSPCSNRATRTRITSPWGWGLRPSPPLGTPSTLLDTTVAAGRPSPALGGARLARLTCRSAVVRLP